MSKISELSDGGALQSTDYLIAVRSGGNVKVQANGAASFTTLTASGDVNVDSGTFFVDVSANRSGFGTTNPAYLIDAQTAAGNAQISVTAGGDLAQLILKSTDTAGNSQINFADADSANIGMIQYFHNDDHMEFTVNGSEAARIDSSQNLLVALTSESQWTNTAGFATRSSGSTTITRSSAQPLLLNRLSNDGDIAVFYKNGAAVGSIGSALKSGVSRLLIGTGDTGLYFFDTIDAIYPVSTTTGIDRDAAVDLGESGARFKDLYLSGGVYLGGTGAANKLDDYEEGTWTPTYTGSTSNPTVTYDALTGGRYTKIGNMVIATFLIRTDSVTGGSGQLRVSGLPFTVVNASANYNAGVAALAEVAAFGGDFPSHGRPAINTTNVSLHYRTTSNGAESVMDISDLGAGANANTLVMTVIYEAA